VVGWVVALALISLPLVAAGCDSASSASSTPTVAPAVLSRPSQLAPYHIFVTDLVTGDVAELGTQTYKAARSVHGLGLSTDGHTLFVSDIAGNRLLGVPLDGGALATAHSAQVGSNPVHMVETLDAKTIYVTDFGARTISVVDAATWATRATITACAAPHSIVISPDGRWIYVGCYGGSAIAVIDTARAQLVATIPLGDSAAPAAPYGLAISRDGRALYASDKNTSRLFVIDTTTRQVATTVPVGLAPALITRSPDGAKLYVADGGSHSVSVVSIAPDPLHPTVRGSVPVDGYPHGIAITPDGRYVVVANTLGQNLSAIDTATLKVIATIPAEKYPNDVLVTP
jgi:YVTN family beta-propeller protein